MGHFEVNCFTNGQMPGRVIPQKILALKELRNNDPLLTEIIVIMGKRKGEKYGSGCNDSRESSIFLKYYCVESGEKLGYFVLFFEICLLVIKNRRIEWPTYFY